MKIGTEDGFKEDENLFYASTHQRWGYPNTGEDPTFGMGNEGSLSLTPLQRRIVNRYILSGKTRRNFREKWREILDEMERFQPEVIIMSAGGLLIMLIYIV
jgi:acetoin utilization deacetylase AcuC-like enzyme